MPNKPILGIFKQAWQAWNDDRAPRMGAALAYYSIFSLAPLLLLAVSIAGFFLGEQEVQHHFATQLTSTVGPSAAAAIGEIVEGVRKNGGSTVGTLIGLMTLLIGASGVFVELHDALNTIWRVQPKPDQGLVAFFRERLVAFAVVIGTGFVLLASVVATTVLSRIEHLLEGSPLAREWFWSSVNHGLSFTLIAILLAVVYKLLPDKPVRWSHVWLGAIVTAVLFTLGNYAIGVYLARTAVASAFGAAGSVIVVLTWVYYSAQIVLFGAEICRTHADQMVRPQGPK